MSLFNRMLAATALLVTFSPCVMAQTSAPATPAGGGRGPAPPPARFIGVALALEAAQTAVASCTAGGYNVSVSVLDAGGVTRLIYASDAGMLTAFSEAMGGGQVQILGDPLTAFIGLVALDVWEWTPLMFLILLAGLQSLPQEPFEAARVDGAGPWRTFVDHTLPMLKPVLAIAIVLRTIDAFGTFDQVFVLTRGGPGEATRLLSIFGYDTAFKFQQTGYAAALFVTVGLIVLAFALFAVRMLKRAGPE